MKGMRIAEVKPREMVNPFLADVRDRMRKGLRASSADDMLAQLLGEAYDHPATTPKVANPSQGVDLVQPAPKPQQTKEADVRHRTDYQELHPAFTPMGRYTQSVFASPVRGEHLDRHA